MARGDHIRVRRPGYWHHGIDCGDGTVIHYAGSPWNRRDARVVRTPLSCFTRGGSYEIVSRAGFGDDIQVVARAGFGDDIQVVARAMSRVGEKAYSVVRNNCEHFAHWCAGGRARSPQVRRAMVKTAGTVAVCVLLSLVLRRPVLPA